MQLLQLEDIEKHFGGLPAVDGVSLGAGKSTLLKLVVGLETPSSGKVVFAGKNITKHPPHRVRQSGVAMVQQTPRSFPTMSVWENVALGALFGQVGAHKDVDEAVVIADRLLDFVGLGDHRGDKVDRLTLHQQRFLGLARALAGEPRLLLLDEVMAGLNDYELDEAIGIVRTIRDQFEVTVIWVEHVMKAVMNLAERVIVLDFGKVLAEGQPEDVMRDPEVIEAYLGEGAT